MNDFSSRQVYHTLHRKVREQGLGDMIARVETGNCVIGRCVYLYAEVYDPQLDRKVKRIVRVPPEDLVNYSPDATAERLRAKYPEFAPPKEYPVLEGPTFPDAERLAAATA